MKSRGAVYLDANASTKLKREVRQAIAELLEQPWMGANPSSIHDFGRRARREITRARESAARVVGREDPEEIAFCSSGSEANQWAIRSVLSENPTQFEWWVAPVEHDCILQLRPWAESIGVIVRPLLVDSEGRIRWDALPTPEGIRSQILVSVGWVNNETGVIQDFAALEAARAKAASLDQTWVVHCDAAQALGKFEVSLGRLPVDLACFSAHKVGAPAGVGLVWSRPGNKLARLRGVLLPGKQEKSRRGGTENLLGLVGLRAALDALESQKFSAHTGSIRTILESQLSAHIPGCILNGASAPRVSNTTNVSIPGVRAETLVQALDLEGFCVSTGSACSSGSTEPSHVLMAMGKSLDHARSSIRISLSLENTEAEVESFVGALSRIVLRMTTK